MSTLPRDWRAWLCAGLGSGWLPLMPGTWGSLFALLPAALISGLSGPFGLLAAACLLWAVGCWLCADVLAGLADADPGWIVIDEWVGVWIAVALAQIIAGDVLWLWPLAFVGFRLFDIWKPGPVAWCERHGPAWWSIMADDVMAGVLGGLLAGGVAWLMQ